MMAKSKKKKMYYRVFLESEGERSCYSDVMEKDVARFCSVIGEGNIQSITMKKRDPWNDVTVWYWK